MPSSELFSSRLQRLMDEALLTQTDLAARAGVEDSTVTRWLRGTVPRRKQLVTLAKVFGMDADALVADFPPSTGSPVMREDPVIYGIPRPDAATQAAADAVAALTATMDPDLILATIEKLQSDPTPQNLGASRLLTSALRKRLNKNL